MSEPHPPTASNDDEDEEDVDENTRQLDAEYDEISDDVGVIARIARQHS